MPRFFLDCYNGLSVTRDLSGLELDDYEAARLEAIGVLPELARDLPPADECRVYTVDVRSAVGQVVYTASLCFVGRRVGGWEPAAGQAPELDRGFDGRQD